MKLRYQENIGALRMKREELKKEAFPWIVEEENTMYDKYLRNEWVKSIIKKCYKWVRIMTK